MTEKTIKNYPLYYMWHIVLESERKVREAIKHFDVSILDWRVIFTLHDNPGFSNSQISKEALIETSVLSRTIKSLEKRGIVRRAKKGSDQRYKLLALTAKGQQLYKQIIPIVVRQQESNLYTVSKENRDILMQVLKVMKENVYRSPYLMSSGTELI